MMSLEAYAAYEIGAHDPWVPYAETSTGGRRIARFFLYIMVATIPLVSFTAERTGLTSQWVRITISDVSGAIAVLCCLFLAGRRRARSVLLPAIPFLIWVVLGALVPMLSSKMANRNWVMAIFNPLIILYVFALAEAGSNVIDDSKTVKRLMIAFAVGAAFEGVIIVHDMLGMFGIGSVWFMDRAAYRLRGTFRANGQLGQYGMAMLFMCYALAAWPGITRRGRAIVFSLAIVGGLGTYYAARRSAVFCILLWAAMLAVRSVVTKGGRKTILSLVLLASIAAVVIVQSVRDAGFADWTRGEYEVIAPSSLGGLYSRGTWFREQLDDAVRILGEHPVLGCGIGNASYHTSTGAEIHNGVLALVVESGLLGVLLLMLPLFFVGGAVLRTYRLGKGTPWRDFVERLTISFIAWIIFSIHNRVWRDRTFWVALMIVVGMEVVLRQYHDRMSVAEYVEGAPDVETYR